MLNVAERIIREPLVQTPERYARRIRRLALAYCALFAVSILGICLLVWQAQLFVALSQRSNVETLTIAFFLVFFAYMAAVSAPGMLGSLRLAGYAILGAAMRDRAAIERRKLAARSRPSPGEAVVALNRLLEQEGKPGEAVTLSVADEVGAIGAIVVDGAKIAHRDATSDGSNSLLAYFVEQVRRVAAQRGIDGAFDIVAWKKIDDEMTEQYLAQVQFARNLEQHLGGGELWPKLTLPADAWADLERRLSAVCPALRDEAFLPDWEYAGQHKLPLIPEPLGLISLSRTERRVDPVAALGCAAIIVIAATVLIGLIIAFPPWVPGT